MAPGLTSPMLKDIAGRMKTATEDVWIGKDGLVRRIRLAYSLETPSGNPHAAMTMDLYDYGAHVIWGATARILKDLLAILRELLP